VRRASIGIAAQPGMISRRVQVASGVEQASGAMVASVEPGGPADVGGVLMGDTIVALDGIRVSAADDLIRLLDSERIGRTVALEVIRNGRARQLEVSPRERSGS